MSTPEVTPVTTPPDTVALALLTSHALYNAPAAPMLLSVIEDAAHTESAPLRLPASGDGLTMIVVVALSVPQLLVTVYVIVSLPAFTPVITPALLTVALSLLTLHVPPAIPSISAVLLPEHTPVAPVIAGTAGIEPTVTVTLDASEQPLVLVPVTV